jgi:hypothetical protein
MSSKKDDHGEIDVLTIRSKGGNFQTANLTPDEQSELDSILLRLNLTNPRRDFFTDPLTPEECLKFEELFIEKGLSLPGSNIPQAGSAFLSCRQIIQGSDVSASSPISSEPKQMPQVPDYDNPEVLH